MEKKIKRIRKSIKNRKMIRHTDKLHDMPYTPYETIQDEERHGVYNEMIPPITKRDQSTYESMFRSSFFYQLFGSIALFMISFLLIKGNVALFEKPERLLRNALEQNFPFAMVHDWYVQHLGIPLALVPEAEPASSLTDSSYTMPLTGEVVESFNANGTGIQIMPETESYVRSFNKGIVIFAGTRPETGKTIVIQHADQSETTYGHLSELHVHLYELVGLHDVVGSINPEETTETFYFSIEQETGYVDPVKVINVDGTP